MYLTPPDSQNLKKKIFGVPQNFSKITLEVLWFWFRWYSETSTRYSKTSTENGLVFLGLSFAENAPLERLSLFFLRNTGQNVQCVKNIRIIHVSCMSQVLYVCCCCLVFRSLQVSFFRPMPARVESWKWKHGYAV